MQYYWRWVKKIFTHRAGPLGQTDLWAGIVSGAIGVVDRYLPDMRLVTDYGWQVFIWVFIVVLSVRLFLAPYWMAKGDANKIKVLEDELNALKDEQKPKLVFVPGVVYEPDSPARSCRHVGVRVQNAGLIILESCRVGLENMRSDKGVAHNSKGVALLTERLNGSSHFTLRPGESIGIEVGVLDERNAHRGSQIDLQYESPIADATLSCDDVYYFNLAAYGSVGSPCRKKFKLYVNNDHLLRMEEMMEQGS